MTIANLHVERCGHRWVVVNYCGVNACRDELNRPVYFPHETDARAACDAMNSALRAYEPPRHRSLVEAITGIE